MFMRATVAMESRCRQLGGMERLQLELPLRLVGVGVAVHGLRILRAAADLVVAHPAVSPAVRQRSVLGLWEARTQVEVGVERIVSPTHHLTKQEEVAAPVL